MRANASTACQVALYEILVGYFNPIQRPGSIHGWFACDVIGLMCGKGYDKSPSASVVYRDLAFPGARQVSLTISSFAQSHCISRGAGEFKARPPGKSNNWLCLGHRLKSTKASRNRQSRRQSPTKRAPRRKTKVTLLQNGGERARWRLLWRTTISPCVMADYARQ